VVVDLDMWTWTPWRDMIVYIAAEPNEAGRIYVFDRVTRATVELARLDDEIRHAGLTVSPDGGWILCGRRDALDSNITLVENFH
jgi:hypothetical protein